MQTKAPLPAAYLSARNVSPLIETYFEFSHLKHLYRRGWLERGIPPERCESVAEHAFGVALLALLLVDAYEADLDHARVIRLALLHDLGEVYAGDIIPGDAVDPREKHCREEESVVRVLAKLPEGDEYLALWREYERGESPEARYVRQIDRLEMALQAAVYEHQEEQDLSEFYASAQDALSSPHLRGLLDELEDLRS
jgi:putative hydrolase of HD superfamily